MIRELKSWYWPFGAGLCCLAAASIWLGTQWWPAHDPQDYEECLESIETKAVSKEDRATMNIQCGARFAGRRKPGGGYTYHDFMQNRHFDIAGPNPSPEELKKFDQEYTGYLEAQRKEALAAAVAKKQSDLQADLEKAQQQPTGTTSGVGPPMIITPTIAPATVAKELSGRSRAAGSCEDGSLSCSWSKLSTTLKSAFGSAPKAKVQ